MSDNFGEKKIYEIKVNGKTIKYSNDMTDIIKELGEKGIVIIGAKFNNFLDVMHKEFDRILN